MNNDVSVVNLEFTRQGETVLDMETASNDKTAE